MSPHETDAASEDALAERIAGDLHDGLVQWLVGAKMQAEAIRANHREGRPISGRSLDSLVESLQSGLVEARRLLRGLHGPDVSGGLWHAALRGDLAQSGQSAGAAAGIAQTGPESSPRLEFDLAADTEPLAEPTAATAYRLLREAAWNAQRHAKATTIRLSASRERDWLILTAADDGRGFDPRQIAADRMGVSGMIARARRAGGTATLDTAPGRGTRYEFRIPIGE